MTAKTLMRNLAGGTIVAKVKSVSCANVAAFNTAFTTTSIATEGYDAVVFILTVADDNATPDYVFSLYESNTSVTDAGTLVAADDVVAHGINAAGTAFTDTKIVDGVLTMTHNDDEDLTYVWVYRGNARWVRLQGTVGTKTQHFTCVVIKTKGRFPFAWG